MTQTIQSGRYKGKSVLVTGAGSGLGRACAVRLAAEGARVAIHYNSSEAGALQTLKLIEGAGGSGMIVAADGRSQTSVQQAVSSVVERFGRIDAVVNNAGKHRLARSLEQNQHDGEDMIGCNLSSTFFFAQAAGRHMRVAGGGHIVNVSSKMATSTAPSNAAYCATKAGVIAMTQVLAAEWARYSIRVNCVAPGVMATGAAHQMTSELDDGGLLLRSLEARTPVGRLGEPDEVATVIAFLASGETDFLTGSTLYVDGGWTSYGDYTGWGFVRSLIKQQQQ
jgi:NAD(P)-dependent dehydrogenase (short-subunit alcohol dehydrogenase family)